MFTFIVAAIFLANSQFKSQSNDSKYYTELVVRYQNESWQNITTPKWGENFWGFDPKSYMTDQFPGQIWLGVILTKLGIPAAQALHILGMAFQVLSLFLLVLISREFISVEDASVLFYTLLLTPLAFSYNIRANHELEIMFFSFLALYSGLKLSDSKKWILASMLATLSLLLIKGPFFIFGFMLFTIGIIFSKNRKNLFYTYLFVISCEAFLIISATYFFDQLFLNLTGLSFIKSFWNIQIEQRAMLTNHSHNFIIQKILNFNYYFTHYLGYSMPWIILLIALIKNSENRSRLTLFLKSSLSLCLLSSSFIFCAVFSLSDRTAGRYVFPGYYLFSAWVILGIFTCSPFFKKWGNKLSDQKYAFIPPLVWLITFALHFLKV